MIISFFLSSAVTLLALYIALFSLWRIAEQEHLEDLSGILDVFFPIFALSLVAGKLPGIFFSRISGSPFSLISPFSGSFSWPIAIMTFLLSGYLLLLRERKDPWRVLDLSVIPVTLFLVFTFGGTFLISLFRALISREFSFPLGLIVTSIVTCAFWGESKLLRAAEQQYRTFFWYRYRRNSAQTGFVAALFCVVTGILLALVTVGEYPFTLFSLPVIDGVSALILMVSGFVILYVRSGRLQWKKK